MAGLVDLVDAEPAFYGRTFYVVSGTNWQISMAALDSTGAPVAWSGCTASAKLRRSNGSVVKTITNVLAGGLQIDLSTAGTLTLRATPACTFADEDLNRPLIFNLLVSSAALGLVLTPMQRCFIVPQPNLN